jgi:hypothetical protein
MIDLVGLGRTFAQRARILSQDAGQDIPANTQGTPSMSLLAFPDANTASLAQRNEIFIINFLCINRHAMPWLQTLGFP